MDSVTNECLLLYAANLEKIRGIIEHQADMIHQLAIATKEAVGRLNDRIKELEEKERLGFDPPRDWTPEDDL